MFVFFLSVIESITGVVVFVGFALGFFVVVWVWFGFFCSLVWFWVGFFCLGVFNFFCLFSSNCLKKKKNSALLHQ